MFAPNESPNVTPNTHQVDTDNNMEYAGATEDNAQPVGERSSPAQPTGSEHVTPKTPGDDHEHDDSTKTNGGSDHEFGGVEQGNKPEPKHHQHDSRAEAEADDVFQQDRTPG
jgi:hypothetical protein